MENLNSNDLTNEEREFAHTKYKAENGYFFPLNKEVKNVGFNGNHILLKDIKIAYKEHFSRNK